MKTSSFRMAHVSDLHFSSICWSPTQFFSKRFIGNANLLLTRKRAFTPDTLYGLIPLFHEHQVDVVMITGDLSSTSLRSEFAKAKEWVEQLKKEGFRVFALPGNHDHYTKSAYRKKLFYDYFDSQWEMPFDLRKEGLSVAQLADRWWLVALDTALATPLFLSTGHFSEALEEQLEKALQAIPASDSVILSNHFPLFCVESPRKSLIRKEALAKLLTRFPQVKLYLHGHTHRHTIADLRASHLPIVLDSGSTGKKDAATWNLLEIDEERCLIKAFKSTAGAWQITKTEPFAWKI